MGRIRKLGGWAAVGLAAMMLGGASGAAAEEAGDWLDRWAEALGGRERLASAAVVHVEQATRMHGLDGVIHQWSAADGRHRLELDLGGIFRVVQVFDGSDGWVVDPNGKLSRMSGVDLEGELTNAYVSSFSHLLPGRRPGRVELLEAAEDGAVRLRLHPEGGNEVTVYLDPESALPTRTEQPAHERTEITTIAGWTRFEGIAFPTETRSTTGDAAYDTTTRTVAVELLDTIDEARFARPAERASDVTFTNPEAARAIPIELAPTHIFLQTRIAEQGPYWFVLDTGASVTVLNTVTAEALDLELAGSAEGRGAGEGSTEVRFARGVSFTLPGLRVDGQTVAAIDLSRIEAMMGRPIDGIFGYDLVSRMVVEIDYAARQLRLHAQDAYAPPEGATVLPLALDGSTPYVQATVTAYGRDPIPGRFMVDSGAGGTIMFARPFTETHRLLESLPASVERTAGFGIGGASTSTYGRLAALDLGGLVFAEPNATFPRDESGAHASPDMAGLIGGGILKRTTVAFDYEGGRMVLVPNERLGEPFAVNASGMSLTSGGREHFDEISVLHVDPGLPAAAAGIAAGDRLVTIDGRAVGELGLPGLAELFEIRRGPVPVELERDGERVAVTLDLASPI